MIQHEQPLGAAVAVGFDDEDDLVVFISSSADVLRCPRNDWRALVNLSVSPSTLPVSVLGNRVLTESVRNLKSALEKSGIHLN